MPTQRDRAERLRRQKLDAIEQRVQDGSLVIRSMTAKEREKYLKVSERRPTGRRS